MTPGAEIAQSIKKQIIDPNRRFEETFLLALSPFHMFSHLCLSPPLMHTAVPMGSLAQSTFFFFFFLRLSHYHMMDLMLAQPLLPGDGVSTEAQAGQGTSGFLPPPALLSMSPPWQEPQLAHAGGRRRGFQPPQTNEDPKSVQRSAASRPKAVFCLAEFALDGKGPGSRRGAEHQLRSEEAPSQPGAAGEEQGAPALPSGWRKSPWAMLASKEGE